MAILTFPNPHWEALTPQTHQAFYQAASLPFIAQYYLAGGTGLALHLGHRYSIDLDFFSPNEDAVNQDQRTTILQQFTNPTLTVTHDKNGTFVADWSGVGLSFFRLPAYPLVQPTLLLEGVFVASLEEIGAMKLAAIIDRGTRKDMVDMFFILQQVPLEELFKVAAQKYPQVRTFAISATRGLDYFIDAEAYPMPRLLRHVPWRTMKRFLEQQVREISRKNLPDLWK